MEKVQNGKIKKIKKILNQRSFLIFCVISIYLGIYFVGLKKKLKNILEEEQVRPNHKFSLITYCIKYHLRNGS